MATKKTALRTFIEGALLSVDYLNAVGIGAVDGHSKFGGVGRRDSLATTVGGDDLTDIPAVAMVYPNQTVGEQMTVKSDSVNDTAAGSGARTVKVHYLDASGNYSHEVITLNGTTGVNTVATNIRFIQLITVETLGSFGGRSAGNIDIHALGAPATIYARITAGSNMSLNSARMVPNGKTFYMTDANVSATSGKAVSVRLQATCDHAGIYTAGVFQFQEIVECQDSTMAMVFLVPRKIPSLAIIKGVAISTLAGGSAAIAFNGWLE